MIQFDDLLFASLAEQAAASPRRRQHYNLHKEFTDPSQRLLNFLWQDTYSRPHRHMLDPKPETLVALSGAMGCITFNEFGQIKECCRIRSDDACPIVVIEPDEWHTVVVLSENALLLEAKAGPFNPDAAKEVAPWAVPEDAPTAISHLNSLKNYFNKNYPY